MKVRFLPRTPHRQLSVLANKILEKLNARTNRNWSGPDFCGFDRKDVCDIINSKTINKRKLHQVGFVALKQRMGNMFYSSSKVVANGTLPLFVCEAEDHTIKCGHNSKNGFGVR